MKYYTYRIDRGKFLSKDSDVKWVYSALFEKEYKFLVFPTLKGNITMGFVID